MKQPPHTSSFRPSIIAIGLAASALVGSAARGQCDHEWSDRFALPGLRGTIYDMVRFDDGSGEKIYVAGEFRDVGSLSSTNLVGNARGVVRWNGSAWENVGPGIGPFGNGEGGGQTVYALAKFDPDGAGPAPESLYIGGDFFWSNHTNVVGVARLNNNQWEPVGGGMWFETVNGQQPRVLSMTVFDPDGDGPLNAELFAAGWFAGMGGATARGVAKWDGQDWSNVGGEGQLGTYGNKVIVCDDDGPGPVLPALYYGGQFGFVGTLGQPGFTVSVGLARWDGAVWTDVPGIESTGSFVQLATFDDGTSRALWSSGNVKLTGGSSPLGLYKRENGAWTQQLASPLPGPLVRAMGQFGGEMFFAIDRAGFPVTFDPGETTLARWSPASPTLTPAAAMFRSDYSPVSGPAVVNVLRDVDFDLAGPEGNKLFIGGNFRQAGDQALHNIALWNGTGFEKIADGGSDALGFGWSGMVRVLETLDPDGNGPLPEELFVASGETYGFFGAGTTPAFQSARFNGASYQAISYSNEDPEAIPQHFAAHDDGSGTSVFIAASTSEGNGHVFRLNGSATSSIGFANGSVQRVLSFDDGSGPALWAFGHFNAMETPGAGTFVLANGVAKWTPAGGWVAADAGLGLAGVREVAAYDRGNGPELYTSFMARWTGTSWDTSASVPGRRLEVFNGELYVGGQFESVNGIPGTHGIAKWNGVTWSSVGGGLGHTPDRAGYFLDVADMKVHDDGSGTKLYVVGDFTTAGGVTVRGFAVWDGSSWSAIETGDTGCSQTGNCYRGEVLGSFDGGLYVGGFFTVWDGKAAAGLTALVRPCDPCPADFNHSGAVTVQDIFDFLGAYFAGSANADFNGSGSISVQDIFDFLTVYFLGCP